MSFERSFCYMVNQKQIKIIKRAQRHHPETIGSHEEATQSGENARVDAVTTVTQWIRDFRQRQSDELNRAIKLLGGTEVSTVTR